ncbi:ELWxxDGT repeat protein [Flaviaesturariibacter amylovorans]|uniref:T9SS type A sorting domain-containing protein n=1 Tax=Flaviaesturariibacter amylovorans TaxID=1084520 RepID=A0ABP8H3W9_9BACT
MRFCYLLALSLASALPASAQNPVLIKSVSSTTLEPESDALVNKQRPWNGKVFYAGKGSSTQAILAVTDGTAAGTVVVKDLGDVGGVDGVYPAQDFVYVTTMKSTIVSFPPLVVNYERRLWRTDGTAAGTVLLKAFPATGSTLQTGTYYSDALSSVNYSISGNTIYFGGFDAASGNELWKSDGTASGTAMVKDVNPGTANSNPSGFCKVGSVVCFFATDGTAASYQLWKTDGTAGGTEILTRINTTAQSIAEFSAGLYRGKMYFWANDGNSGAEVWYTDGTPAGTQLLKETIAGNNAFTGSGGFRTDLNFIQDDRYLYFPSERSKYVWRTDGTTAGTIQLNSTALSSQTIAGASARGNRIYWLDNTTTLYTSDGTAAGTRKVIDNLSQAGQLYSYKGAAWMQARPPAAIFDAEPWRSDGTAANTARALDVYPGSGSSSPFGYFELNGYLYFFASNSAGKHLFRYLGDMTFNGSIAGGRWRDSANWNSGMPPGFTDTAYLPAGLTAEVSANRAYAGQLVLGAGSSISLAAITDTLFIARGIAGGSSTGAGVTVFRGMGSDTVRIGGAFSAARLHVAGIAALNAPLSVGSSLDLAPGARVLANDQNLTLTGNTSAITGAGPSAYIVTNGTGSLVQEGLGPSGRSGAVTFPIGTATHFNPATLTNAGTTDAFRARVQPGVSPSYSGESATGSNFVGNVVNSTWMLGEGTPGGSDVTVSLQWNAAQELAGFNRAGSQVGHYRNGAWQLGTAGAATGSDPYTRSESGITSFSPFSVFTGNGVQVGTAIGTPEANPQGIRLRQSGNRLYVDLRKPLPRVQAQLLTMSGQVLFSGSYRQQQQLTLTLPPVTGFYLLVLRDENGLLYSGRVLGR